MREKLKSHFLKIGPRRFVIGTVLTLIILDVLTGYYLRLSWMKSNASHMLVRTMMTRMEANPSDFSPETLAEMSGLGNQMLDFMLLIFFINNLFFYFFYMRKKLWAQSYILVYALTAAMFSLMLMFGFDSSDMGLGWFAINVLSGFIYLYIWLGVKLLKHETTLAPKKKGQ